MKPGTKTTSQENLFLGAAFTLALSLCVLEYGKPLLNEIITLDPGFDLSEAEEEIPVVRLKLPEPPKPAQPKPQLVVETASFVVVPDLTKIVESTDSTPEITVDDITTPEVAETPLIFVQHEPEFPGGEAALFQFLSDNLHYPAKAIRNKIFGTVYVQFVIGKDGSIDTASIEILGNSHPWLNEEAKRVVKKMPRWKPGLQQGMNVSVYRKLPVRFKLVN